MSHLSRILDCGPFPLWPECRPAVRLLVEHILSRLERELRAEFSYHNLQHTLRVMGRAFELAADERLSGEALELLMLAAAFHDSGFLVAADRHEQHSVAVFSEAAARVDELTADDRAVVSQMILDTMILPGQPCQQSHHPLSKLLLDADMAGFGSTKFLDDMRMLFQEQGLESWKLFSLATHDLMLRHQWHTKSAALRFDMQKQRNQQQLLAIISSIP